MSSKMGSARGRTNSTSSKGNHPSSSSNSAPSPMSADQYAMELGFTTEKYDFQHATIKHIKEWFVENGYLQDIDQGKNVKFLNEKSKLLATLAQATTDADFQRLLPTTVNASTSSKSTSSFLQEDEEQVDPEYDLDNPFLDSQPM
ncbi:hypothetical protein E6C27_scaffold34G001890 [Cucumis melo var. makuwa]|uniref:Uncharacterized protein n=1 Tax=Cucumis melo var. makuwa TaxID=1194695 RepID=A0A5A7SNT5_CUCMM|nr:hypothetical protein E6C27_scaffold34G001890 [Cucumis melo var. makuwa]